MVYFYYIAKDLLVKEVIHYISLSGSTKLKALVAKAIIYYWSVNMSKGEGVAGLIEPVLCKALLPEDQII